MNFQQQTPEPRKPGESEDTIPLKLVGCYWLAGLAACFATPWAWWHQWRIRKQGRRLTDDELEILQKTGVEQSEPVFIREVARIPNPLFPVLFLLEKCGKSCISRASGITLGRGIYVAEDCAGSQQLIAHELVHVAQYQRAGSIWAFMVEYVYQCLVFGYHDAPWEIEARRGAEGDFNA